MTSGLSLANKVQLLFGTAVVVLLAAALAVPWFRTEALVYQSQLEVSRQLADTWLEVPDRMGTSGPIPIRVYSVADARSIQGTKPFVLEVVTRMEADPALEELFQQIDTGNEVVYDYARALRGEAWSRLRPGAAIPAESERAF